MAGEREDRDERDDEFETELDEDRDERDEDDGQEETVESLKTRLAKMERALKKSNRQAARLRLASRGRRDDEDRDDRRPARRERVDRDERDDEDRDERRERRREREDRRLADIQREADQWRTRTIRSEAKVALTAAGANPERLSRLVKLIDTDDLDMDGDDILGLDEQIEELKEDFPELFRREDDDRDERRNRRRPVARIAAGDKRGAASRKPKTEGERVAEMILGSRRR